MLTLLKNRIEVLYPNTYTELYIENNILFCKFNDRFHASHFLDTTMNKRAGDGTVVRDWIVLHREFLSSDIKIKLKKVIKRKRNDH